jgi:hypothetical protein
LTTTVTDARHLRPRPPRDSVRTRIGADEVEELVDAGAGAVPRHALDPALEQQVLAADISTGDERAPRIRSRAPR